MLENEAKTPEKPSENNTSTTPQVADNQKFVDSDNGGIEDFRKVLNIPVEKPEEKRAEKTFEKEDPFGEVLGGDDLEGIEDLFDPEGEGMDELFEDSEALSEMCVELLDLGMNYASQAISMDWGQDEKYSIPDSRKRKLRKPLAKLLAKRAPKVSPELAFIVFVVALYSPQLIKAYGVRRDKMNKAAESREPKPMSIPRENMPANRGIAETEADEYEAMIREMREKSNSEPKPNAEPEAPKRKVGRPKGSKDTKPRKPRTPKASTARTKGGAKGASAKKA